MAIQMRRGQEVNFDADKMLPGEWAVSLDTRYVRMCFAPGVCVRMATYDAFEVDMTKVEAILAECQTIEEVVTRINTEVSTNAQAVAEYTIQAKQYRDEAEEFRNQAEEIVGYGYASKEDAGIIRGGDNYIDENGTLVLTRTTTSRELTESQAGGIRIISMDGESQQKQYSGKNLLSNTASTNTTKGITFTVNADKSITVKGTATGIVYLTVGKMKPIANQSYIFSHGVPWEDAVQCYLEGVDGGSNWVTPRTFTPTTDTEFSCRIYIANGKTVNLTFYPMIRLASITDSTYEPYVGGIASPNPEYEQDVDSVEVSEIWTHGKNLEYNSATYEGWGVWSWDGTITGEIYNGGKVIKYGAEWQFRYPPSRLFKAGTYTVSFDARVKNSGNALVYSQSLGLSKEISITASSTFKRYSYTFTVAEDKRGWVAVLIPNGNAVGELYVANIQVEEGSETPYEPYTESKITLSAPITLRSIGDVKDVLCKQNGVYGILRRPKKYEFTSIRAFLNSTNTIRQFADVSDYVGGYNLAILCNRLIAKDIYSVDKEGIMLFNTGSGYVFVIRLPKSVLSAETQDAFLAYLKENVEVYYIAGPTFEPLPLADQIALHKLESFGGVTYLFTDSTIEPIIEVEYGTSKVGGYAIKGLNNGEISLLELEQLKTLTNELATQIVAGSEA